MSFYADRNIDSRDDDFIAVVGAVNVDICGVSRTKLILGDSNPGGVTVTPGGVGRNISENLVRLGARVKFVTALGTDAHAEGIRRDCDELGLDISQSLTVSGMRTSTYLCVSDCDGDIVAAVNDMDIYEELSPAFLAGIIGMLNRARLVVFDSNIPHRSVDYLAENCTRPLVADPVSVKKAVRLKGALGRFALIKPNRPETAVLTGVEVRSRDDLPIAAKAFFDLGLKRVLVSLGDEGVYFNDGRDEGILPCYTSRVLNTSGCGDAFLSAAAMGLLSGENLREMAKMGLAAASVCAESERAVNPHINMQVIRRIINAPGEE